MKATENVVYLHIPFFENKWGNKIAKFAKSYESWKVMIRKLCYGKKKNMQNKYLLKDLNIAIDH